LQTITKLIYSFLGGDISDKPCVEIINYCTQKDELMGKHRDSTNCKLETNISTWTDGNICILKITLQNGCEIEIPNGNNLLSTIKSNCKHQVKLCYMKNMLIVRQEKFRIKN
jgi:hypothetical protein